MTNPPPPPAPAEWLAANGQFLAASVGWVREVLRQHAPAAPDGAAGKPHGAAGKPPGPQATPDAAARALRHADDLAATVPPPALVTLGQRAALTRFERDILLMCAAAELDPSIRGLCAAAQGNPAMTYPTFALAMTVLPAPAWDALAPGGRLRDLRLIEVNRPWGESLISSPLRTDERIVNYLKGLDHLDARLSALARPVPESDEHLLPPSHLAAVTAIAVHLAVGAGVVQLTGPDQASALTVATAATARAGLRLLRMPAATVPRSPAEAEDLTRLWQREGMLSDIALCVDVGDNPAADPAGTATDLAAFTDRLAIPVLVRAREGLPALGPRGLLLDIDPPTMAERHQAWQRYLPAGHGQGGQQASGREDVTASPDALAAQFAVDIPTIAVAAADPDPWARCRALTRPQVDGYAQRIQPAATWDDLVLGGQELRLLHGIADQVRNRWRVYQEWGLADRTTRGLGLSALFCGPSGTGKTLAAEVLASELSLDLYRTDLSAIVSKYIGETEKNLRQLFDAAEAGGWLLLFDEADALFGKRTEVTEANDRFANIQVDYLLQRMEEYRGLAILSTNMRSAMDEAFLRRLRFIVEFEFPDAAARRAIWALSLPASVPGAAALDLNQLAGLPVTGGMIRNIAVNAAFLAAAKGGELGQDDVGTAVQDEFAKLKLPLRQQDLARLGVTG
jgi:hypothetical protein